MLWSPKVATALTLALIATACAKKDAKDASTDTSTDGSVTPGGQQVDSGSSGGGGTVTTNTDTSTTTGTSTDTGTSTETLPPMGVVLGLKITAAAGPTNNTCLPLTVTATDALGSTIRAEADAPFVLADQTATYYGGFYSDATCHTALGGNASAVSQGESKVTVYYENAYPAAVTVHATGTGLLHVTDWQATLAAKAPHLLGFGPVDGATGIDMATGNYTSGQCVGPFTNVVADASNTYLVLSTSETLYDITYVSGNAKVFPTSSCTGGQEMTQWKLPAGAYESAQFWIKGTTDSQITFKSNTPDITADAYATY